MKSLRVTGALALALAVCASAEAQIEIIRPGGGDPISFPQPGRQLKTGTARVKGRILSVEGTPVRRAQVRISGPDILTKSATTDNDGVYEFRDLPAGRFTISASKSGFVNVSYGQRRPFEAGKPVELRDAQVIDRADIVMPKGSAIAGRIVDDFGEPIADVVVTAMRSTWSNGRRRLQSAGRTATTNDLGQYRIYGLPPGEYYVSATLRGAQEMMMTEMAVVASLASAPPPDSPRSGYAPTYYPGTSNGNEAQKISVAIGQEAQSADFGLVGVRLAKVSGSVMGADGRPLEGVMVTTTPRNADTGFITAGTTARTDKAGNFTLNGVAPGEYTLQARTGGTFTSTTSDGGNVNVFTMVRTTVSGPDGSSQNQSESGSVPLLVAGDDVANVVIVTSKGATVTGQVAWEGGSKPTTNTLRVTASAADADTLASMLGGSSSVTAEGTFEIRGLAGTRIFRVANAPAGWILKAVRVNGNDITDNGIDIKPNQPVSGVEIVMTSRQNEVNGSVKAGNDPATDYTVVIFSDEAQKWTLPMTRHIFSARPNQEGRFQVKNLPAGSYYAIALEYIAQGEWNDPEVLERLKSGAERFTINEGETQTLDLKLQQQGN